MCKIRREVRMRPADVGNGWFVILRGGSSNGSILEYACVDPKKREPFRNKQEASTVAEWVASHYLNDDGSQVLVIDEEDENK